MMMSSTLNSGRTCNQIRSILSNSKNQLSFYRDSEARLFERYREKLLIIKQNIHSYMLTPKDAFIRVKIY